MALDASATLAEFMVDGWPDEQRFNRLISAIIDRLTAAAATPANPVPPIAAYGEMVTVLWKRAQQTAAIRLEELWSELGRKRAFHLSCGWPLDMFSDARDALAVEKICSLHTHVLPKVGGEPTATKDRQRMSMLWQLKANRVLQRVSRISRQTLGFYRDASAPGWIDLRDALEEVLSIYQRRLHEKNIAVIRKIRPNLRIFAPLGEVKYILSKLVANAFDSSFQGTKIYLAAREARHPETGTRGVRICVGDQGIGLTDSLRAQVFSPFFAARNDINVGLGLWTVKDILERRGGFIRCRSKISEPSGTMMTAFLPVQPALVASGTPHPTAA
jgi:signal transduction histidine kinase